MGLTFDARAATPGIVDSLVFVNDEEDKTEECFKVGGLGGMRGRLADALGAFCLACMPSRCARWLGLSDVQRSNLRHFCHPCPCSLALQIRVRIYR